MNALAQVSPGYRKALKNLNNKMESLDGVFDEGEDDLARILSGRLTSMGYTKASTAKRIEDGSKGDLDFEGEQIHTLDEVLRYILNDGLE